ncbi:MAG: hypothetical protein ACFCVE_10580 [Phycisphaerae bacterium]
MLRRPLLLLLVLLYAAAFVPPAAAQAPTRAQSAPQVDDIFKSVSGPTREPPNANYVIAFILSLGGMIILLALLSQRINSRPDTQVARAVRSVTHNHRKLLREVLKVAPLKRAELKQLEILAEGENVKSPLTLILSPSTLARAIRRRPEHVDIRIVNGLARKVAAGKRPATKPTPAAR